MKNVIYPLAMAWGVYSLGVEAKEKQPNIVSQLYTLMHQSHKNKSRTQIQT